MIKSGLLRLKTEGDGQVIDITEGVQRVLATVTDKLEQAVVSIFAVGSTVAITTMEYEPGGISDLKVLLERLIPQNNDYSHNQLNHDSNAHAHLRAALIGPGETVPVIGGRLALGTWQQIVLVDFDDRPRERTVHVQVSY